jgi:phosphoglycerate dehydrogenase-like enzyme
VAASATSGLLVSRRFLERYGDALREVEREARGALEHVVLGDDPDARLDEARRARIELAYFSGDLFPERARGFFAAALGAPNLRWLHAFNAGVDHPVFQRFLERGVRLTSSAGASAEPIAQTALAGLLWLARGFPHWQDAQRRRTWQPIPPQEVPRDLRGQTLVIVGLGGIGGELARLARAVGLHVIGIRRSPARTGDPVDELHPPARLRDLLPRADWLALACPLSPETRRMIDADALARLPRGARLLNVGRGELVDEAALVDALRKGHLAGAYLDVFEVEPLPPLSPLWDLPGVILTPHNSAASRGNERRQAEAFLVNLRHWLRGEPLLHEASSWR